MAAIAKAPQTVTLDYRLLNPNYFHLSGLLKDDDVRYIFLKGGSSSGKSFSFAQAMLIECLRNGYSTVVFRKTGRTIQDTTYKTFQEAIKSLHAEDFFKCLQNTIRCLSCPCEIRFSGLDEPDKIKGLESYQYIGCEELSDFDEADFKQISLRLRGKKGQKVISLFNPISEDIWIKKAVFDREEWTELSPNLYGKARNASTGELLPIEYTSIKRKMINAGKTVYNPRTDEYEAHPPDMVILESTYLNNFWVVGSPDGKYGFYDRQAVATFERDKIHDTAYYRVYALGEWGSIKTGGEFFHAFELSGHTGHVPYTPTLPVHISIDNNVLPYISVAFWQVKEEDGKRRLVQVHEIAAEDPMNTVTQAATLAVNYLSEVGHTDMVYLYGDASTKANNTIDDERRTFFDKFIEVLSASFRVEDRMPRSNPSVAMTGDFINHIFAGNIKGSDLLPVEIMIDEDCKLSITDYRSAKKDANGAILKKRVRNTTTGQTYEEYGHLCDTMRYVIVGILKDEYTRFSLSRHRNKINEDDMQYYDADKLNVAGFARMIQVIPSVNGMFVCVSARVNGSKAYIDDAILSPVVIEPVELSERLKPNEGAVWAEVGIAFMPYVRSLREYTDVNARREFADAERRITANLQNIRTNFYFRSDYDANPSFAAFMENILDYKDKKSMEAASVLASLSERIVRTSM